MDLPHLPYFYDQIMGTARETWLLLLTTPLYMVVIGVEILLSNMHGKPTYTVKNTFQNIYLMLANAGIDLLFRSIYVGIILGFCYEHRIAGMSNHWGYWVMLFIAEDFMYYWLHRTDHFCRFFWATHVTHHSSEKFNLTVGFRSSVMEPLYRFVYFMPIAALGFEPMDIAFVYSATQIWGILVHTEKINKLGWLEYILVTPSHHRVHHASNPRYLDKNMGMFLIIWDKLFGTFQAELDDAAYEPVRYGLTKPLVNENARNLILHEWTDIHNDLRRKDIGWKDKACYLFARPGWSHDGSRQTSEQLRSEQVAEKESPVIPAKHSTPDGAV